VQEKRRHFEHLIY